MQRPASSSAWRPCSLLLTAAAGVLTGLAETSFLEVRRDSLGELLDERLRADR